MRYLKPLRPFLGWSQLSIPTVYDDSLSYYEVLNKCIFHFNEMLKVMQENYEIIDEAFAKILEECESAIARCEEAAARAEAAQSAAEKAQAAAEAAQAAAEAAQKLAEAAQAAAETARDDAITAQKAAEAAQAAAEAAQTAAEAAQQKAETAQAAAEAAQAKAEAARDAAQAAQTGAESAQEKAEAAQAAAESARDAAQAAQTAAEAAQTKAEASQTAAENARDAAQAAQSAAETAQAAAESAAKNAAASEQAAANSAASANTSAENAKTSETNAANSATAAAESASNAEADATNAAESAEHASTAADQAAASATNAADSAELAGQHADAAEGSAQDAAASAEEIKNALGNYYDKTESDATFVKKAGDTMTGKLVMDTKDNPNNGTAYLDGAATRFRTIYLTGAQDFNNLLLNGIYCRSGRTDGDKNYPSNLDGSNFVLIVIAGTNSEIIKQIFFNHGTTPDIYIRFSYLNEDEIKFGDWEKIATTAEINNSLSGYLPLTGGTMTGNLVMNNSHVEGSSSGSYFNSIPAGLTDLNNLNVNGYYASYGNLTNSPKFSNYFLYNNIFPGSYHITQIAFQRITGNNIAIRNYDKINDTWSDWTYFTTQDDITGNYLPLSGGTMNGNITMSNNSELVGNASTSSFLKENIISSNQNMDELKEIGYYTSPVDTTNITNLPENITGHNKSFSCFIYKWQKTDFNRCQLLFSGNGADVLGIYFRMTVNASTPQTNWSDWVRLDNVSEDKIISQRNERLYFRITNYENNFQHIEAWVNTNTYTGRNFTPGKIFNEKISFIVDDDIKNLLSSNISNNNSTIIPIKTNNDDITGYGVSTLDNNKNLIINIIILSDLTTETNFAYYLNQAKVIDILV